VSLTKLILIALSPFILLGLTFFCGFIFCYFYWGMNYTPPPNFIDELTHAFYVDVRCIHFDECRIDYFVHDHTTTTSQSDFD